MLGEFFVSDAGEIDEAVLASGPGGRHPVVTAKGLGPVEIGTLGRILGAGSYDEVFEMSADAHRESESGESGVVGVPTSVCDALTTAGDLTGVAAQWAATDELRMSRWQVSDALDVLEQLTQLVESRAGKPVWYWWSL
jgi:hypothetical protein